MHELIFTTHSGFPPTAIPDGASQSTRQSL